MNAWNELYEKCMSCTECPLHESRKNVVFGTGDQNAEVMFIGEAPGEREDLTGEPFVGRAGQLLDDMLASIGLSRQSVYIANILKCRPPQNRDPLPAEQERCIEYLRAQVSFIRPKIIVCLGRIAAMRIISPDFKISRDHGIFYERKGFLLTSTYHPAALLRDPRRRPESFSDLKKLEAEIDRVCERTL